MMPRHSVTPSRWAWLLPLVAAGLVVGCEESLSVDIPDDMWGFVFLDAAMPTPTEHRVRPEAFFFRGRISGVPNSQLAPDSCNTVTFTPGVGGPPQGVTYLDAGSELQFQLGSTNEVLPRVVDQSGTIYALANSDMAFTPGDSVMVSVPGATGGFPQVTLRGKTSEPFTINDIAPPGGTETIQLNWSAPSTSESAMIISLRFSSTGVVLDRQVLCAFQDDGVDSIPFRWYQEWASSTTREVVATRLRTRYTQAGQAFFGVVSTYSVPTPQDP